MERRVLQKLIILAIYGIAMLFLIIAFATDHWIGTSYVHAGLFKLCYEVCDSITHTSAGKAAIAFLSLALIAGVVSGFTFMIGPVSAGLQITAGVFEIIGAGIYVGEYTEGTSTRWSFGLAITSAILLLASGIGYAIISKENGCAMKPEFPCKSSENA